MTKEKIRILHRVLAITFLVTAALALITVLVAGILSMTNTAPLEQGKITMANWLVIAPVYLFCVVCLGTAVLAFVYPPEYLLGEPSFDARYDAAQMLLGKKMYEAEQLAPYEKYDQLLYISKIAMGCVSGVSLFASLICIRNSTLAMKAADQAFMADVIGALLPLALYTLTALAFCLAARLLINKTMKEGIEYAAELLKLPVADRPESSISTMQERDMKQMTAKQRAFSILSQVALYAFLIVMAIIVIFPFYWMIISSLKSLAEYKLSVPTLFPKEIIWSNYLQAFTKAELLKLFKNTVIVGIVSTILSLVITVITAFAFARLEFKGKNALFAALLGTMMIPGELFTITNYITVDKFNWVNNDHWLEGYSVLIVPFLVSIFYIYLLKQNFMQIPNELYLAAKVDGTSDFKYLCKVMIPLSLPTLISITILKMMGAWNSYVWPRLVAHRDFWLITNGLRSAFTDAGSGEADIPVQMAAVTVVSIPLFLVFIFLRKYIMKGVSRSGIKG